MATVAVSPAQGVEKPVAVAIIDVLRRHGRRQGDHFARPETARDIALESTGLLVGKLKHDQVIAGWQRPADHGQSASAD